MRSFTELGEINLEVVVVLFWDLKAVVPFIPLLPTPPLILGWEEWPRESFLPGSIKQYKSHFVLLTSRSMVVE